MGCLGMFHCSFVAVVAHSAVSRFIQWHGRLQTGSRENWVPIRLCPDDPSPPQRPARANEPLCLALGYTCSTCIGTPGADRLKKNLKVFCRMWKDHAVDGSFEVRCRPDWTEAAGALLFTHTGCCWCCDSDENPWCQGAPNGTQSRRRWSRFASWAFEGGGGSHVRFVDLSVPSAFSTWMVNSMYFTYTNYPIR